MPKYKNFYKDMLEFVNDFRKGIGFNVSISMIFEDNTITLGIHLGKIPMYTNVPPLQVKIEEADLHEPGENLTKVIHDQLLEYLKPFTVKN